MSRYADAEWLLGVTKISNGIVDVDDIYSAPSIDIVRCKECKYWQQSHLLPEVMVCTYVYKASVTRQGEDYCSRGERKESE